MSTPKRPDENDEYDGWDEEELSGSLIEYDPQEELEGLTEQEILDLWLKGLLIEHDSRDEDEIGSYPDILRSVEGRAVKGDQHKTVEPDWFQQNKFDNAKLEREMAHLRDLLKSNMADTRLAAAFILIELYDDDSGIDILFGALNDSDNGVALKAAANLVYLGKYRSTANSGLRSINSDKKVQLINKLKELSRLDSATLIKNTRIDPLVDEIKRILNLHNSKSVKIC